MAPPPMPAITAFYAALIALLLLVLAARISMRRMKTDVGVGDGGDRPLQLAIRAHGNAVEWAVPVLLLMLLAELNRADPALLHGCGIALVVARIAHAIGLSRSPGRSLPRAGGILLTWLVLAVLAAWNAWAFLRLGAV